MPAQRRVHSNKLSGGPAQLTALGRCCQRTRTDGASIPPTGVITTEVLTDSPEASQATLAAAPLSHGNHEGAVLQSKLERGLVVRAADRYIGAKVGVHESLRR